MTPNSPSIQVGAADVIVKPFVKLADPPPGAAFVTVTVRVPVVAPGFTAMFAWISVELFTTKLVTEISVPKLNDVTASINCVPTIVTFSRLPLPALTGATLVIVGTGLATVNDPARDAVPPPGAGFVTATSLGPIAASEATEIPTVI